MKREKYLHYRLDLNENHTFSVLSLIAFNDFEVGHSLLDMAVVLLGCYYFPDCTLVYPAAAAAVRSTVVEQLLAAAFAACIADYTCKHNIVVAVRNIVGLQQDFEPLRLQAVQLEAAEDPKILPLGIHLEHLGLHRASLRLQYLDFVQTFLI